MMMANAKYKIYTEEFKHEVFDDPTKTKCLAFDSQKNVFWLKE